MSQSESFEGESPMVEWLLENGKKIIWAFSALLLILFLLFRLYSGSQVKAEKDFLEASKLKGQLFDPSLASESLEKLHTLVQRHPSLQAELDGLMAQSYVNLGEVEKATPLLERNLKRIQSDSVRPFTQNAETALLLSQGKFEDAYAQALALKTSLSEDKSILYTFNLLRLGMLEQALGKKEEEKKTWEEFMAMEASSPAFQELINAIDISGASLVAFIKERQKKL